MKHEVRLHGVTFHVTWDWEDQLHTDIYLTGVYIGDSPCIYDMLSYDTTVELQKALKQLLHDKVVYART